MTDLSVKVIQDPRVDFEKRKTLVQEVGGHLVNYNSLPFTPVQLGSVAQASTQIADGLGMVMKPVFHIQGTWTTNCTQVNAGSAATKAVQFGAFGVSSNAFYKLITSANLQIGGQNNTWSNINNTIDLIMNQRRSLYVDHSYYSRSALLPDNCISFHELYLTNKNVLGGYYNNGFGNEVEPRSTILTITSNPNVAGTPAVAVVSGTFEMWCPWVQSPFHPSVRDSEAFIRAGTLQLQLNLVANSQVFFNADPYFTTITSSGLTFNVFELLYQTIDLKGQNIDIGLQEYRAWKWDVNFQTITQTITAGSTQSVNINQIQWPTQPELIINAFRPIFSVASVDPSKPNYYFPVSGANITYINSNALSVPSGHYREMYEICLRNGANIDFATYCGQDVSAGLLAQGTGVPPTPIVLGGAPLIVNPVLDLAIGEDVMLSAGVNRPQQFQYAGNFYVYNQTAADITSFEYVCLRLVPQIYKEVSMGNYAQVDIDLTGLPLEYVKDPSMANELRNVSDISGSGFKSFFSKLGSHIKAGVHQGIAYAKSKAPELLEKYLPKVEEKLAGLANRLHPEAGELVSKAFSLANPKLRALVAGKGISEDAVMDMLGRGISEEQILAAHPHLQKIKSGQMPTEQECLDLVNAGMSEDQILNMINAYQKEAKGVEEGITTKTKRDRLMNRYN